MSQRHDIAALQRRLAEFAAARDWEPFHTPKNLAAALSVEAAELLEIFQWLTPEQASAVMVDPGTAYRVRDEVADVLAYLLQFCQVLDIDVLAALAAKIDRNEERFPRVVRARDAGEAAASGVAADPGGATVSGVDADPGVAPVSEVDAERDVPAEREDAASSGGTVGSRSGDPSSG